MPVVGQAIVTVRVDSANLSRDIRQAVNDGFATVERDAAAAGTRSGRSFRQSVERELGTKLVPAFGNAGQAGAARMSQAAEREWTRRQPRLQNLFGKGGKDLAETLGKEFNVGIGAARMGPVVVAALTASAPGAIGAAAAVGVAAAGALTAAVSSTLLTGGLLFAAFKSGADSIKPGVAAFKELGKSFGVAVADGMSSGFNASATILRDGLLTPLYPILARSGELLGNMFTNLAKTITIPENVARIGSILETNQHFIDRFDTGLQGLTSAFLTLFAASKPMIDLVGNRFAEFGQWAASALSAAEANGSLATVMDKLTTLASALFDWIGKLGPAIGAWLTNIDPQRIIADFEAFGRLVGDLIGFFKQIAAGVGPHAVTVMDNLHHVFGNMLATGEVQHVADSLGNLLEQITGLIATLSDNPLAAKIAAWGASFIALGGILKPVTSVIGPLAQALLALDPVLLAVGGALIIVLAASQKLRDALADAATQLGETFTGIWTSLGPDLQDLGKSVWNLAGAIGDGLAPVIQGLTPWAQKLVTIFGSTAIVLVNMLTIITEFLTGVVTGNWQPFLDRIRGLWEGLVNFFQEKWNGFLSWWNGIWNPTADNFSQFWEGLKLRFEIIWAEIVTFAAGVWQGLVAVFHVIFDPIIGWWNGIWSGAALVGDTWWATIVADFHSFFDPIQAWWEGLWSTVSNTFTTWWGAVLTAGAAFWSTITSIAHQFWDPIAAWWDGLWSGISSTFSTWWGTITGNAASSFNNVTSVAHNAFDPVQSWWDGLWSTVANTFSSWWGNITGTAASIWNGFVAMFGGALQPIIGIWDAIWSGVENIIQAVRGFINSVVSGMVGDISSRWAGLSGTISGYVGSIRDAIVSPFASAYEGVVGWVGRISGAVQGLIGGISSAASTIMSTLNSLFAAQSTIAGMAVPNPAALPPTPPGGAALAGLASGGVVLPTPGGLPFLIGEGGRPERVEPLDSQGLSSRDRALITHIVSSLSRGGPGDSQTIVHVSIGDSEITDFVARTVQASNDSLAKRASQRRRR